MSACIKHLWKGEYLFDHDIKKVLTFSLKL